MGKETAVVTVVIAIASGLIFPPTEKNCPSQSCATATLTEIPELPHVPEGENSNADYYGGAGFVLTGNNNATALAASVTGYIITPRT